VGVSGGAPPTSSARSPPAATARESAPIELSADAARHRIDRIDHGGHHVGRKFRGECGAERIGFDDRAPACDHEGDEPRARCSRVLDRRGGFEDPRLCGQLRLDRAEFDAVSAQFHLRIDPAVVVELAVRVAMDEVAGAVHAPERRMRDEARGGRLGAAAVAARERGAADDEFAVRRIGDLAERWVVGVDHRGEGAGDRAADRHCLAGTNGRAQARHGAFGRSVAILEPSAARPEIGDVGGKRLAAHVEEAKVGEVALWIVAGQRTEQCRRWAEHRDPLADKPWEEVRAESRRLVIHRDDGRADRPRHPHFLDAGVVTGA